MATDRTSFDDSVMGALDDHGLGSPGEDLASPMTSLPTSGWTLAVDFGTSFTVVAVRIDGRPPETIEIGGERRIPSIALVDDDGAVYVGRVAEDLAASRPGRALRAPKRRLGEPAPVVLGGKPYQVVELVAALLRHVFDEAVRHMGSPPSAVRLTHPATWSRPRLARLLEAAAKAGLMDATLVPEPVAAALAYANDVAVPDGAHVAVYDLGGGTFDTTVLRAEGGTFTVVGRPAGDANLGGELFDEMLANLVGERLRPDVWDELQVSDDPAWQRAANALRSEARRGKEALTTAPYAELLLPLPGGMVTERITRDDLEHLVQPYIDESVRLLVQCVGDAGIEPASLAAIYQVGGASRMPMIERALAAAVPGVPVSRRGDPKTAVALGATMAEPSGSVLDLQAAGGRTTLESNPGPALAPPVAAPVLPPPPPVAAPAASRSSNPTVAEPPSDQQPTVVGTVAGTVVENGTVVEAPSRLGFTTPPTSPTPPLAPTAPVPVTGPKKPKGALVAAAVAVAAVLVAGIVFAVTRGGDGEKTAGGATTLATSAPVTQGNGVSLPTTSATPSPTVTLSPPSSPSATTAPPAPDTTAPAPTDPPTTAPPATPAPAPAVVGLTAEAADAVLLTVDEVVSATGVGGWNTGVFQSAGNLCGIDAPDPTVERHAVYDSTDGRNTEVTSTVMSFATVDDVNASYNALREAVTDCPDPTTTANGITADLAFNGPFETNIVGVDRTMAFGITATLPNGVQVYNLFTVATKGRAAIIVQYSGANRVLDQSDSNAASKLFGTVAAKMLLSVA